MSLNSDITDVRTAAITSRCMGDIILKTRAGQ